MFLSFSNGSYAKRCRVFLAWKKNTQALNVTRFTRAILGYRRAFKIVCVYNAQFKRFYTYHHGWTKSARFSIGGARSVTRVPPIRSRNAVRAFRASVQYRWRIVRTEFTVSSPYFATRSMRNYAPNIVTVVFPSFIPRPPVLDTSRRAIENSRFDPAVRVSRTDTRESRTRKGFLLN